MCRCEQWLGLWNAKSATSQRALALYLHIRELFLHYLVSFRYSYWSFILDLLYLENKVQNQLCFKKFHYFLIVKIDYNCKVANIFGVLEVHEVSFYSQTVQNLKIGSGVKSLSTVLQNLSPFIYSNGIITPSLANMHVILKTGPRPRSFQCKAISWKNGTLCFQTMQWLLFI